MQEKGFVKYIVLFILLVVFIAMFNIDVKALIESEFVQGVFYYVKVVLLFIYDAFDKVIGSIRSGDTGAFDMASTTVSTTSVLGL